MRTYSYEIIRPRNNFNKRRRTNSSCFIQIRDDQDVLAAIIQDQLDRKRGNRLAKLLSTYAGSMDDVDQLKQYLPDVWKPFAHDLDLFREQLASRYELVTTYEFTNIQLVPDCHGCRFDCMGQLDHMECDTGCLHNPDRCIHCSDQ